MVERPKAELDVTDEGGQRTTWCRLGWMMVYVCEYDYRGLLC